MAYEELQDTRLQDPLSGESRATRRNLLLTGAIGIAIAKVGFFPSEISALGIKAEDLNQDAFSRLIAGISLYFLVSFITYASADYLQWRNRTIQNKLKFALRMAGHGQTRDWYHLSGFVSWVRIFMEFIVPVLVSVYSILILLKPFEKI